MINVVLHKTTFPIRGTTWPSSKHKRSFVMTLELSSVGLPLSLTRFMSKPAAIHTAGRRSVKNSARFYTSVRTKR